MEENRNRKEEDILNRDAANTDTAAPVPGSAAGMSADDKAGADELAKAIAAETDKITKAASGDHAGASDTAARAAVQSPAGDGDDEEFEEELAALMKVDNTGKKGKKKRARREKKEKREAEGKERRGIRARIKGWSRRRKIITGIVAVLVVFFGFKALTGGKGSPQALVMTTPIVRQDIIENLSLSGPISGTDSVDVVSNLHAEVLDIKVKERDKVEKDQVIATIDPTDIQKEVEIAQNSYDLAVSTLNEQQIAAENGYAKAVQDHQDAQANLDRTTVLFQGGSVSQLELEAAQKQRDEAARALRTFTLKDGKPVANESYSLQVKSAEFELEKKKTSLENTEIKSPIAGTVIRVNAKVGRFADKIEDEKPMFIIENLDVLEMKIPVSEYSIGKISVGQPVVISADILGGETVNGTVAAISPTGEEKGGGSSERVIPTTIRIDESNSKLIAGITAKAQITLNESKDTLVIPISALITKEDGFYIAIVENNIIKMVKVETGVESDIQVEIIPAEGSPELLNAQLVTNPNAGMTDGMQVMVMPAA